MPILRASIISILALSLFSPGCPSAGNAAEPTTKLILQNEFIQESGHRLQNDPSIYFSQDRFHAQVWYGDITKGLELGGYTKDKRNSSYSLLYRYRQDSDHVFQFETEQITGIKGLVAVVGARLIQAIPEDTPRNLMEYRFGADRYYGEYNFTSLRAISDPRQAGRWSFVLSNRFATEKSYLTVGLVPRTDGEIGYFVQGKKDHLLAGIGSYNRFDFTGQNRTIFTLGWEWEWQ